MTLDTHEDDMEAHVHVLGTNGRRHISTREIRENIERDGDDQELGRPKLLSFDLMAELGGCGDDLCVGGARTPSEQSEPHGWAQQATPRRAEGAEVGAAAGSEGAAPDPWGQWNDTPQSSPNQPRSPLLTGSNISCSPALGPLASPSIWAISAPTCGCSGAWGSLVNFNLGGGSCSSITLPPPSIPFAMHGASTGNHEATDSNAASGPEARRLRAHYEWQVQQQDVEWRKLQQRLDRLEKVRAEVKERWERERHGLVSELSRYAQVLQRYAIPVDEVELESCGARIPLLAASSPANAKVSAYSRACQNVASTWMSSDVCGSGAVVAPAGMATSSLQSTGIGRGGRLGSVTSGSSFDGAARRQNLGSGAKEDVGSDGCREEEVSASTAANMPAAAVASTLQAIFPHARIRTQPADGEEGDVCTRVDGENHDGADGVMQRKRSTSCTEDLAPLAMPSGEVGVLAVQLQRTTGSQIDDRALRALQALREADALEVLRRAQEFVMAQGGRCRNLSSILQSVCRKVERRSGARGASAAEGAATSAAANDRGPDSSSRKAVNGQSASEKARGLEAAAEFAVSQTARTVDAAIGALVETGDEDLAKASGRGKRSRRRRRSSREQNSAGAEGGVGGESDEGAELGGVTVSSSSANVPRPPASASRTRGEAGGGQGPSDESGSNAGSDGGFVPVAPRDTPAKAALHAHRANPDGVDEADDDDEVDVSSAAVIGARREEARAARREARRERRRRARAGHAAVAGVGESAEGEQNAPERNEGEDAGMSRAAASSSGSQLQPPPPPPVVPLDYWTSRRVERIASRGFEVRKSGDRWELKLLMSSLDPPLSEAGMELYCRWLQARLAAFRDEHGAQALRRCAGELDFSNNGLGNQAVWMLLEALATFEVQAASMKLYKNRISQGGVLAICEFIRTNRRAGAVHEMHLSHNEIDDASAHELLRTLHEQKGRYPPKRPIEGSEGSGMALVPVWVRLNHNRIRDPAGVLKSFEASGISFCAARSAHCCGPGKCVRSDKNECPLAHLYLFSDQSSEVAERRRETYPNAARVGPGDGQKVAATRSDSADFGALDAEAASGGAPSSVKRKRGRRGRNRDSAAVGEHNEAQSNPSMPNIVLQ